MCEEEEQGEGVEGQGVVNILTDFLFCVFQEFGEWKCGWKLGEGDKNCVYSCASDCSME